ncbi:interleukin-6 receptor subunit beta-like isoform X2 [Alosa pseudoharengus]|uniref:interleukin-6 receptor subunit beta-like isoform X2 n=1 Tax=Alosa pseudoharengus TaxID=34774 RepID=UPI003F895F49
MDRLGQQFCRYLRPTYLLLAVVCYGQDSDTCEVIPKNLTVNPGSNVTVMFKAPFGGICWNKLNAFSPSNVFWTLNSKKIEENYYNHNSTYAVVTVVNFTLESGTVECHMDEQVLGGTIIRTQATSRNTRMIVELPKKPVDIHCVTNVTVIENMYTICYWDEAGNSQDTTYKVTMKPKGHCTSLGQNHCQLLPEHADLHQDLTVTITAMNTAGNTSATVRMHGWEIVQFDPPNNISVEPLPTGLSVDWVQRYTQYKDDEQCEAQSVEEGTNVTIVSNKTSTPGKKAIYIGDVKPCTRYTVEVRCIYSSVLNRLCLWSNWSRRTTVLSVLNVSSVPFYLWGKVLKQNENGIRHVQMMWKGPPPVCKAIDEYRLFVDSGIVKLEPIQHNATVLLNASDHKISIAAYKNNIMLRDSFLKIPSTGRDMPPVQRPNATAHSGLIHVSWDAPSTPVNDYVIEWFTDPTQADRPSWERTQETNISFPGDLPYKLYTVTITPLYDDGPGQGRTLHTYAKEGRPAKVKQVKQIEADDTWLTVAWEAVRPNQCCAFVVNYTVLYKASHDMGSTWLNVTVNHTTHKVTLPKLKPSTTYQVYVRTCSINNCSEDEERANFTTEAYGKAFMHIFVLAAIGVISLLVTAVCLFVLWRKFANLTVPNPEFSSMAMWAPEKSRKLPMSNNLDFDNNPSEGILLCHVDTEMDTRLASPADTDSMLSGDKMDGSSVASNTSASSGQAESTGLPLTYSTWECPCKSPEPASAAAVEPSQPQPGRSSPASCNPYLEQTPICGHESPSGPPQGPSLSDKGRSVVEASKWETMTSAPSAISYVSVEDVLERQKEHKIKKTFEEDI